MATAAKSHLTPQDYIGHSFHPDCDFIDGRLEERNLGELDHSEMQVAVLAWFMQHAKEWSIKTLPEMRVQTSATRFRVADVAVISVNAPRESILLTPPLIVVEVLSSEDRKPRYQARLDDYRRMGVKNIWVIDPVAREGFDCSVENWIPATAFAVKGTPIHLSIADLDLPA